jgi:hypothetical protein
VIQRYSTECNTYPLHARPKPYQCRHFLKKKCHLFDPIARHADLLTHTVRKERDVTLRAEVHRYHAKYIEARQKAQRLAQLKQEYNDDCRECANLIKREKGSPRKNDTKPWH